LFFFIINNGFVLLSGYKMASKIFNLVVGGTSIGCGAYFTTWLLTGENPTVSSTLLLLLF